MADLNSRLAKAQEEVTSLNAGIAQLQKSKRTKTLNSVGTAAQPSLRSIKLRRTLKGHFGKVTALHWSGNKVVSASQDGNLLIWNPVSNTKLQSISLKSSYVMAVGMEQSKGNLVACGGLDNLCTVYPRNAPNKAIEMASQDGFLSCCRFLNEEQILTSSGDSTCVLFDIASSTPVSMFKEHTADAMFLALKDRSTFASCSVDLTTKLWDTRSPAKSCQTFVGHKGDVNAVEFMPSDPNCLATCSSDNTVRLYDIRAYNEVASYAIGSSAPPVEGMQSEGFTSLAFSKSGRLIFCGHADGSLVAFDVLKSAPAYTMSQAHERHVSCVGVSAAGDGLCTGSWDSLLKIWA